MSVPTGIDYVAAQLDRLGGTPFEAVHDWHGRTVTALLPELRGQMLLKRLHLRALDGEQLTEIEWIQALEPALNEIYQH